MGSACITAAPIDNVKGVIEIGFNPNRRGNPRGVNHDHVDALYEIIKRPGGKRDSESPICIAVSSRLIKPSCRELMAKVDARNAAHVMPMLEFIRPHLEVETALEDRIWLQCADKKWLSDADVLSDISKLDELRAKREKALLLNGNHRLRALLKLADDINRQRDAIVRVAREGGKKRVQAMTELSELTEKARDLTWRVIVFDGK